MGGNGSGQRGKRYFFPKGEEKPDITWKNKTLVEMSSNEIKNSVRFLIEGWKAALPNELLFAYCGLDQERIDELIRRDEHLLNFKEGAAERLVALARINVAEQIEKGSIKDSRWLLEHVDVDFKPNSKSLTATQAVVIPVEEKQKMIQAEMADIVENIVEVEFSDESIENAS